MHNIHYIVCGVDAKRDAIMAEIQRHATKDGDGYSSRMTWHDKLPPFNSQEEAHRYIEKVDNRWYDDHAVKFLDYSNVKPTKKLTALKERLEQLLLDEIEYKKAHSIHGFKAILVGCPQCGSKLNKGFLSGEHCPLCHTDLRGKTTLDKLVWYKDKKDELRSQIEAENKKQKDKAGVKWLVKYEYHS